MAIYQDLGSAGIVDPGDTLRYTISISNSGAIPAINVVLTDTVPPNTTYVADSLRLNGTFLGSDGGILSLIAGLSVQSGDNLTRVKRNGQNQERPMRIPEWWGWKQWKPKPELEERLPDIEISIIRCDCETDLQANCYNLALREGGLVVAIQCPSCGVGIHARGAENAERLWNDVQEMLRAKRRAQR